MRCILFLRERMFSSRLSQAIAEASEIEIEESCTMVEREKEMAQRNLRQKELQQATRELQGLLRSQQSLFKAHSTVLDTVSEPGLVQFHRTSFWRMTENESDLFAILQLCMALMSIFEKYGMYDEGGAPVSNLLPRDAQSVLAPPFFRERLSLPSEVLRVPVSDPVTWEHSFIRRNAMLQSFAGRWHSQREGEGPDGNSYGSVGLESRASIV